MNKLDEKYKIDVLSLYSKEELLAKNYLGVYGLLYKAVSKKTQDLCLLKEIDLSGVPQSGRLEIYKEAIFLSELQQENFLKFLGFQEFKDKLLYIIEFPDKLLSDFYTENKGLSTGISKGITEEFLMNLLINVLQALQFLEKKIENFIGKLEISMDSIVICVSGAIKLCDIFENFKIIKNIRIEQGFICDDYTGFSPPEDFSVNSLVNIEKNDEFLMKSTIFSLGILICKLIDFEAFEEFFDKRSIVDSQENLNEFLIKIKKKISVDLWEILIFMVNYEPKLRSNVGELLGFVRNKGKKEDCEDFKEILKKKDKDIFFLKDQLRVANEQNQRLSQENEKIRNKNGKNEKENPLFFLGFLFVFFNVFFLEEKSKIMRMFINQSSF